MAFKFCSLFCLHVISVLLTYFSVNVCSHYFYNFQKKVLDLNGPDKNKQCLSVRNFGIQSAVIVVVVCSAFTAYTSLCRGLKYLLKVRYIILVYPNLARFLYKNIKKITKFVFDNTNFHRLCV